MLRKTGLVCSLLLVGIQYAHAADQELAIIVNSNNAVTTITQQQVANIFLGKIKVLPDGSRALPVDQSVGGKSHADFYNKVVQKSPSQLNSYWSRLVFTGKGQPPVAVNSDSEMVEFVQSHPGSIGYVDMRTAQQSLNDGDIKVLLTVR